MKDVGVEQIERVAGQLVRDPGQPPGREERIAVVEADVACPCRESGDRSSPRSARKTDPRLGGHRRTADCPLVGWRSNWAASARIVAERTRCLAGARDSRDDATWQRRCAYKNMTRQDENARPEQNAPFRFDGHAEPARARDESAVNRDVGSEKKESDRSRIGRSRPCGKIVMPGRHSRHEASLRPVY